MWTGQDHLFMHRASRRRHSGHEAATKASRSSVSLLSDFLLSVSRKADFSTLPHIPLHLGKQYQQHRPQSQKATWGEGDMSAVYSIAPPPRPDSRPPGLTSSGHRGPLSPLGHQTLTFTTVFSIHRPPLPKGSQEFEFLLAEFRAPEVPDLTPYEAEEEKEGPPQLQSEEVAAEEGGSTVLSLSQLASIYRRQGAALSLSAALSQKRILKWLKKRRALGPAAPCNTPRQASAKQ